MDRVCFHSPKVLTPQAQMDAFSCYIHVNAVAIDDYYWSNSAIEGVTLRKAFKSWYDDHNFGHLVDCRWPCNKSRKNEFTLH